jgi:hypothetical protein
MMCCEDIRFELRVSGWGGRLGGAYVLDGVLKGAPGLRRSAAVPGAWSDNDRSMPASPPPLPFLGREPYEFQEDNAEIPLDGV